MKLSPLRGRKVVDRVRRKGRKWRGKHMGITLIAGRPPLAKHDGLYAGTSASTKLNKSAVKRNKMRRRCREALRTTLKDTTKNQKLTTKNLSVQLLIQPRSSSLSCDFDELLADAEAFFSTL